MSGGWNTDYSRLDGHETVSLESDLMPIFGLGCTQRACHSGDKPKAELYLGPRCKYNLDTEQCEFNQEGETPIEGIEDEPPLTQDLIDQTHDSLIAASTTAPELSRAEAGKPGDSFLVHKVAGIHEDQGLMCEAQDPTAMGPCGNSMPPNGEALCEQSPEKCDLIAAWILQGAENN